MTKKLIVASESNGMTDDEIYYQGERFIERLSEVIDLGRAALGNRYEFRIIEQCYNDLLKKFKSEERITA